MQDNKPHILDFGEPEKENSIIKVIGVGGGGGNAINTMISNYEFDGVEFMAFNTDAQALKNSLAPITLQLGSELTRGLGVGGDHVRGAKAAEERVLGDIYI